MRAGVLVEALEVAEARALGDLVEEERGVVVAAGEVERLGAAHELLEAPVATEQEPPLEVAVACAACHVLPPPDQLDALWKALDAMQ